MKRYLLVATLVLISVVIAFGQSERQRITYKGFPGGLNSLTNPDNCLPAQLRTATNIDITAEGAVRPRAAYNFLSYGVATTAADFWLSSNGGTTELFFKSANAIWRCEAVSGSYATCATALTAGGSNGSFVTFNETTIYGNSANYPQYYVTPGSGSSTSSASDPVVDILTIHNNRIFGANSTAALPTLYETEVDSATNWASGAAWLVSRSEPSPVTGLGTLRGVIYIFTRRAVFKMSGYSPAERTIETFSRSYGTYEPGTVKNIDLKGYGEVLIFISSSHEVCVLNESGITVISEYIQPTLDGYMPKYSPGPYNAKIGVDKTRKEAVLTFNKNSFIKLFGDSPYQTPKGTRWPFSICTAPASFTVNSALDDAALSPTSAADSLLLFYNSDGFSSAYSRRYQPIPDYDYISDRLDGTGTNTFSIFKAQLQTRDEDAGDNRYLKGWKKATIRTPRYYGTTASQTNDYTTTVASGTMTSSSSGTEAYFNAMNWSKTTSFYFSTVSEIAEITIDYVMGAKDE